GPSETRVLPQRALGRLRRVVPRSLGAGECRLWRPRTHDLAVADRQEADHAYGDRDAEPLRPAQRAVEDVDPDDRGGDRERQLAERRQQSGCSPKPKRTVETWSNESRRLSSRPNTVPMPQSAAATSVSTIGVSPCACGSSGCGKAISQTPASAGIRNHAK